MVHLRVPATRVAGVLALLTLALASGCSQPEAEFVANQVYALNVERTLGLDTGLPKSAKQNVQEVVVALFGTPDEPRLPMLGEVDMSQYLDLHMLQMAAGPVGTDESGRPRGLYRRHCVHCHGVTGDGLGPTAEFLNPYPRDYRPGLFKFKSTPGKLPPTHEDLARILYDGIPGTAMPSFKLEDGDAREALVQYVKYLAIRGEIERRLLIAAGDLEEGDLLISPTGDGEDVLEDVQGYAATIVEKWRQADSQAIEIPKRPEHTGEELAASVERGRKLFFGVGNCLKCHGDTALGDGVEDDFDDWTKEILDPKTPKNLDYAHPFIQLGALSPRNAKPRNLRLNVYRGGRRPIDLYRRVVIGITGTPMPAAAMKAPDAAPDAKGMTPDDVWDLINYVQSLTYEEVSEPPQRQDGFQRDRM